ncbi:hypothetical protein O166_21500 [Pseudogulbenkiania ferrooxidans EGD-HP2]|uniref:Uncharacterized protein n=1 Tax=Pseudogulbenkiania ferrooxidans EGD-HP2 TaxID=1388764 RepID=A0ABN0NB74_9NEIS|nr:hypothetical protein O166_21500 [Pseudogulbenkiania ferrooxidans EGD-HP2]
MHAFRAAHLFLQVFSNAKLESIPLSQPLQLQLWEGSIFLNGVGPPALRLF